MFKRKQAGARKQGDVTNPHYRFRRQIYQRHSLGEAHDKDFCGSQVA
ncbi:MAG: hypothetical protein OSA89_13680 [Mariniblastus sp.]|nr:hypothetical protein [Mariniblastus sp.]